MGKRRNTRGYVQQHPEVELQEEIIVPSSKPPPKKMSDEEKELKKLNMELEVVSETFMTATDALKADLKIGKISMAMEETMGAYTVSRDRVLCIEERLQDIYLSLDKDVELKTCLERVTGVRDESARIESRYRALSRITREEDDKNSMALESNHQAAVGGKHRRKLPKLDLPKFGGDVRDWLAFWSQFEEIDKDESIASADKFQYLIQSTVENSDAWRIVKSYPISSENYKLALDNIKERYGRKDLLVKVYFRELLKLVIENAQASQIDFSNLYVKLSAKIRALGSLGVTTDSCASIIYPVVESCLPEEILRAWQRNSSSRQAVNGEDELNNLMEFLKKEVQSEDNIRLACGGLSTENEKTNSGGYKQAKTGKSRHQDIPTALGLLTTSGENSASKKIQRCLFCDRNHSTEKCGKADHLTLDEKRDILQQKKACYQCLKLNHQSKKCRAFTKCLLCSKKHETIMCPEAPHHKQKRDGDVAARQNMDKKNEDVVPSPHLMNQLFNEDVFLQTLKVKVHSQKGILIARVVVDHGSSGTYLSKNLANKLELAKLAEETKIHGLFGGETSQPKKHGRYYLTVSDVSEKYFCQFYASDTSRISGNIPYVSPGPWIDELKKKNIVLTDTEGPSRPVDILIGADIVGQLLTGCKVDLSCGPTAIELKLGWTLIGQKLTDVKMKKGITTDGSSFRSLSNPLQYSRPAMHPVLHVLDVEVAKLWTLDAIGIMDTEDIKSKMQIENETLKQFLKTIKVNSEGRYEVCLPWIQGHQALPTNKWISTKCLRSTTEKLRAMDKLEAYDALFKMWEADVMIEEVPEEDIEKYGHVIPHRAVFNPSSTTTPIRPVFNASCKVKGQPSLNQCLEKGPNLLEQIPKILTRFRLGKVGVLADIKKAFQQISVRIEDRDMLRFYWWKDLKCQDLKMFRHCRVVFGVSTSPFILAATLKNLMDNNEDRYPDTIEKLRKTLYVDNVVAACTGYGEAEKFKSQANELMESGKFELRGWEIGPHENGTPTSLLGLKWNVKTDMITLDLEAAQTEVEESKITKRKILSISHSIYDPLGLVSPFTIIPRMLLQEAWELKTGWDTPVPEDMKKKFQDWKKQIPQLKDIEVPRWITAGNEDKRSWSLHVFVDSSKTALGVCIFLRVEGANSVDTELVRASSRVAPLKKKSIPRLELIACTLGVRLAEEVKDSLELPDIKITYWSDSSTALHWIKNTGNWGVFVQNRVNEVRKLSDVNCWRHVPGEFNPADLPSRGCSAKYLATSRWCNGPDWLKKTEDEFPVSNVCVKLEEVNLELKKTVVSGLNKEDKEWCSLITLKTFEEMVKHMSKTMFKTEHCSGKELMQAEESIWKKVQEKAFTGEDDGRLKKLRAFKDQDGLIKLKTRLLHGDFEDNFKTPVTLPCESPVVHAFIMKTHLENTHGGIQFMQCKLREQFWIINSRRTIRMVLRKCQECQRFSVKKLQCPSASLPVDRIQSEVPFEVTGTDLTGPLLLSDGRKAWIVIFTCAVYRAIHLELTTSLSTESYIIALRRFINRRGRPRIIYSDNGTNLVGCRNAFQKINWPELEKHTLCRPIQWKLNPPSAPWWGGWYERLIGIVKNCLRRVLGKASLSYEELETVLIDVESTVNQRPLTYVSEDPEDLIPLTPSLILTGCQSPNIPEADLVDEKGLSKRWEYIQRIRADLRSRYKKEYLGQMASNRGPKEKRTIKVGDVVIVGQENKKRIEWPIGKISEVFPGKDGVVRTVKVKTSEGVLLRPLQRIYPLEVQENTQDETKNVITKSGRNIRIPTRLTYLNI